MSEFARRIAVIADVHGNSPGLRAVARDIASVGVDESVVLGDVINGIDPLGSVELIDTLPSPTCVLGNAEMYLLTPWMHDPPADQADVVRAVQLNMNWTRARLGPASVERIRAWSEYHLIDGVLLLHDSPVDRLAKHTWHRAGIAPEYQEILYHSPGLNDQSIDGLRDEVARLAHEHGFHTVVAGHTHESWGARAGAVTLRTIVSAGMPLDGDHRAGWGVLTLGRGEPTLEIRRVDYDRDALYEMIDARPGFSAVDTTEKMASYKARFERGEFVR